MNVVLRREGLTLDVQEDIPEANHVMQNPMFLYRFFMLDTRFWGLVCLPEVPLK